MRATTCSRRASVQSALSSPVASHLRLAASVRGRSHQSWRHPQRASALGQRAANSIHAPGPEARCEAPDVAGPSPRSQQQVDHATSHGAQSSTRGQELALYGVLAAAGVGVMGSGFSLEGPGSVVEALAVLAAIIAVHESGHFAAARSLGIHVTRFAIGFGPVLWRYKARPGCWLAGQEGVGAASRHARLRAGKRDQAVQYWGGSGAAATAPPPGRSGLPPPPRSRSRPLPHPGTPRLHPRVCRVQRWSTPSAPSPWAAMWRSLRTRTRTTSRMTPTS
jgi:hypothetical protein